MSTVLQCAAINARVTSDPAGFIHEQNEIYRGRVKRIAEMLKTRFSGRGLVMLCGPSASGKTTTAALLQQFLCEQGRQAHTVSLDDFYLGRGFAPRLPDGSFDYETIDALDLPLLHRCMDDLLNNGTALLPLFDFHSGARSEQTRPLAVEDDSLVILEGIHALNPRLRQSLGDHAMFTVCIGTFSAVYDGEACLFSERELRLVRRLLRDARFRNSPPDNTLDMWRQVVRGEDLYLLPYVGEADVTFDTTHAYEPALFSGELLPLLTSVPSTSPYYEQSRRVAEALERFSPLSPALLPPDSLLKEFMGAPL